MTTPNAVPSETVQGLLASTVGNFDSDPQGSTATGLKCWALQVHQQQEAEAELQRLESFCEGWGLSPDNLVAHIHQTNPTPAATGKGKTKAAPSGKEAEFILTYARQRGLDGFTGKELMEAAGAAGQDMSTSQTRQPLFRAMERLQENGELAVATFKRGDQQTVYLSGK